jgi:hypothetical protein
MNTVADFDRTLLQLNMSLCERVRPRLHKLLSETKVSDRYICFPSDHESQLNNLIDVTNDTLFYEQSDPLASMASHIETCVNKMQGVMVCFGFGLGYGALMLLKQKNFVSRSIIILEPDPEVLLLAFRSLDCRAILESEDILLLVDTPLDEIPAAVTDHILQKNRLVNAKNLQVIDLPAAYSVNKTYFDNALQKIGRALLEGVKVVGNCPNDALEGLDTSLTNLKRHSKLPGISSLKGMFQGKPGVVVAAGPSLDKNIHLLGDIQDKAVIVSVDASLRHLSTRGIKPHFVTSVERITATSKLFHNLDSEAFNEVFLVGAPVCHPDTFEAYKGPQISCDREHGYSTLLALQKGLLIPGPSAGNMAYRLLRYLGCDPIILVGQDLAVSEEGKTHADGNPFGDCQPGYLFDPSTIEGNYVEALKTNPILKMFHNAYEYDVAVNPGTVINATEGGAKITGTQIMTLQEAINSHITSPLVEHAEGSSSIFKVINDRLEYPSESEANKALKRAINNIESAIEYLNTLYDVIERSDKTLETFKNRCQPDAPAENKETLLASMDELSSLTSQKQFRESAMDVVSAVFFHTMMNYVAAMANSTSEAEQDAELERNLENLGNNFRVLLRYLIDLYEGHLFQLTGEQRKGSISSKTLFSRNEDISINALEATL